MLCEKQQRNIAHYLFPLLEITPCRCFGAMCDTVVVADTRRTLLSEHLLCPLGILSESQVIIYVQRASHALHVKVVRADKSESPSEPLLLLDEILHHREAILLRAVLLAVSDYGYKHIILCARLGIKLGYALADGIVEWGGTKRPVVVHGEHTRLLCIDVIIVKLEVVAVERYKRDTLLHLRMKLLHLLTGGDSLVKSRKSLAVYDAHAARFICYDKIVNLFCVVSFGCCVQFLCFHCTVLLKKMVNNHVVFKTSFIYKKKVNGKN